MCVYFVKLLRKRLVKDIGGLNIVYLGSKNCCGVTAGSQPLCTVKSVQIEARLEGNRASLHTMQMDKKLTSDYTLSLGQLQGSQVSVLPWS